QKESSGSQFYLVTGQVFSLEQLAQFEQQRKGQRKQQLFGQWLQRPENSAYKERYLQIQQARDQAAFDVFVKEVLPILEAELASENFGYSEAQKQAYTTVGGSPHLDGDYTVFGEVVEGMDVLDKLGNVKTAPGDRPLEDVVMTVKVL
ncbi:MAG: peptidylprolyl isomerase, partial [Bacteroidota bacterium]